MFVVLLPPMLEHDKVRIVDMMNFFQYFRLHLWEACDRLLRNLTKTRKMSDEKNTGSSRLSNNGHGRNVGRIWLV